MGPPIVRLRPAGRPIGRSMRSPMAWVENYGTTHDPSHEMTHGAAYHCT